MCDIELAWKTFDFHSENISKLEEDHLNNINKLNVLLKKQVPATKWQKLDLVNKIIACCNKLESSYLKHTHCLEELIKIYKHRNLNGISIPAKHHTDIDFFNELKNINATLIEEMKVYKSKVTEVLD